jgi:peptidyl-prolyl cis-trans isomerase A (cyclophilin A)
MNHRFNIRRLIITATVSCCVLLPGLARATIVEVQTNVGNFQINLYDIGTPQTVANFLSYAINLDYSDSIIHRSALTQSGQSFVIQGGGFKKTTGANGTFDPIQANAPVINEPEFANVPGTIAMARPPGSVNTATNQWFINMSDNSAGLDGQDFAVFGEVVSGMDVVDMIAAFPRFNLGISPFGEIPLQSDPGAAPIDDMFLVVVDAVIVIDMTVDSAGVAGLTPVPTTAGNAPPPPPAPAPTGGGGGGSFGLLGLLGLAALNRRRRVLYTR